MSERAHWLSWTIGKRCKHLHMPSGKFRYGRVIRPVPSGGVRVKWDDGTESPVWCRLTFFRK